MLPLLLQQRLDSAEAEAGEGEGGVLGASPTALVLAWAAEAALGMRTRAMAVSEQVSLDGQEGGLGW